MTINPIVNIVVVFLVLLVHYTFFNNGDCMGYKKFYVKFKIEIVYVHEVLQLLKIARHL